MSCLPGVLERARPLLSANLAVLAFLRPAPLPTLDNFALLGVHTFGLLLVVRLLELPWFLPIILAAIFLIALVFHSKVISPAILAPFLFVYGVVALRVLYNRLEPTGVPGYFEYALADWRIPLLDLAAAVGAAALYSLLILGVLLVGSRQRGAIAFAGLFGIGVLVWAAWMYFGQRTHGATGSDPYAYVQMGIDLAQRGVPVHRFPLFPYIADLKLPWYPLIHTGYHLPFNPQGDAISVWSPGGAMAYALAFRLGGEQLLYLVHPLFSSLSAVAAGLVTWELTRRETQAVRTLVSAGTIVILTTSNEIVAWSGVTMADAQATFLSVLTIYFSLLARKRDSLLWAAAAGVALGCAYQVRHTQLVLVLSATVLFLFASTPFARRARNLLATGVAALGLALPDLWYHQTYLGAWWRPESEELSLYSLDAIVVTADRIYQAAFTGYEFGWVGLALIAGSWLFARRAPIEFAALATWLGASLVVHLPYSALRLRDLTPEFPVVAFLITYGLVGVIAGLASRRAQWAHAALALLVFAMLDLSLLRSWRTIERVAEPPRAIFGAMTAAQRASFDAITQLVPSNALVGASLNSGAIDLYGQRATFRPADWSSAELREFLTTVNSDYPMIYLLEDNASLTPVLNDLHNDFRLELITTLDVPLFGAAPVPNPGALWRLETK